MRSEIISNYYASRISQAHELSLSDGERPEDVSGARDWLAGATRLLSSVSVSGVENAIIGVLEKVSCVDAVFCEGDLDDGVVRVFSVVRDHDPGDYEAVLAAEMRIRNLLPKLVLDFRIRAHQGRQCRSAVPTGSNPIYVR